jgi:hypothetical protein
MSIGSETFFVTNQKLSFSQNVAIKKTNLTQMSEHLGTFSFTSDPMNIESNSKLSNAKKRRLKRDLFVSFSGKQEDASKKQQNKHFSLIEKLKHI